MKDHQLMPKYKKKKKGKQFQYILQYQTIYIIYIFLLLLHQQHICVCLYLFLAQEWHCNVMSNNKKIKIKMNYSKLNIYFVHKLTTGTAKNIFQWLHNSQTNVFNSRIFETRDNAESHFLQISTHCCAVQQGQFIYK